MLTITKTEAVNEILRSFDGSRISDITQTEDDTAISVVEAIDRATRHIQIKNEWNFNWDGPRTLTADIDGNITVPTDYIFIKFLNWTDGRVWDLTVKSGKLYDQRNATSTLSGSVDIVGTRLFDFDECPVSIQEFIVSTAKAEFLANSASISPTRIATAEQELREAKIAAYKWDAQQKFGMMDVTPGIRQAFRNRGPGRGLWWEGY